MKGRLALITGSSAGIGFGIATGLARAGASVVLNARNAEKLEAAAAKLKREGLSISTRAFDVTDGAATRAGIDAIEKEHGPLDILVNNAGTQHRRPLEEFPEAEWRRIMSTNLDSVFLAGQAAARHMIKRKSGKIINICSVMSELARPSIAPYAASKGGVKMLTRGMAADWGKHNIQVNGIAPGYFKTELNQALAADEKFSAWIASRTPLGRWGEVEELQGAAVFLASRASDFITGHILYVDGGITATV